MKFTLVTAKLALFGLVAGTPLTSPNEATGLEDRAACKYKDSRCCAAATDKPYPDGYPKYTQNCRTITVKAGKSIQKAIDSASKGDQIIVEAGTYAEQLTITKDGIYLYGKGAILVPPKKAVTNGCSGLAGPGTQAGICVHGSGVKLDKFISEHRKVLSVKTHIKNVVITGFTVQKFSGLNIAILGAKDTLVVKNKVVDAGAYGTLTAGSINTIIAHNKVTSTQLGFIGICMDNQSDVLVSNNKITNQIISLCVQTTSSQVQFNKVSNGCYGAFVDPGVQGAKIIHNYIGPSFAGCGQIGVTGIFLDGPSKAEIRDNVIEGQKNNKKGAGVVLVDDPCSPRNSSLSCYYLDHAAIAKNNVIIRNTFLDNDYDIFLNTTGTGNVVECNKCTLPRNLCSK